jgi:predicted dehydrogenase/threonine dehydrogenase-like Zn-dependent dehydrogenase
MKQVIQTFKTGDLVIADVPAPAQRRRGVIVRTCASLVSAGTERMVVNFAKKNFLQKAKARPDLVRQVIDKARTEGILTTVESVRSRIDQPLPLGYSSAGVIIEVGEEATNFRAGDHVACAGLGYAAHAEVAYVPRNLVAKLPDAVPFEAACFTTIGAIALQGVRQGDIVLGHNVAVIGLGLLGQVTVQILKAAGSRVFGIDLNAQRVALAMELGADLACTNDRMAQFAQTFTSGRGFDAVLITADTSSAEPVRLAGEIARSRAIIVAVGATGMDIPRKIYYEKELDFRLSRSYGPGRYDTEYEEKGQDYPYDYVRWTEQRNMEAFVDLLATRKVDVRPLITHRFPIADAGRAYELITGKTGETFLGVVLTYSAAPDLRDKISLRSTPAPLRAGPLERVRLGVIGAGSFAQGTLLPAIKKLKQIDLIGIASAGGLAAKTAAQNFGFAYCTSANDKILSDAEINTVAILTRHNHHARQVISALETGKNVYVEKPLCLTEEELDAIISAYEKRSGRSALMVGFNRRFAHFVVELKERLMAINEPLMLNYRVNAGFIPKGHWVHDSEQGGGRLLGEACHFIDLLIHLSGSQVSRVTTKGLPDANRYSHDNLCVILEFCNGSIGTLTYVANGDKGLAKEFLEVFGGGLAARMDNFRSLLIQQQGKKVQRNSHFKQDKGFRAEWQAFASSLTAGRPSPIAFADVVASSRATLAAWESLESGEPIVTVDGSKEP